MIKIFAINVSEEVLNKFKDFEIHSYYDTFCLPMVHIYNNDELLYEIIDANYDRINTCIRELRG